jgi:uncharacterized coiled-coil protein SlyX
MASKLHPNHSTASHAFNVAKTWEQLAALNSEQEAVIDELNKTCTQRPYPSHVSTIA